MSILGSLFSSSSKSKNEQSTTSSLHGHIAQDGSTVNVSNVSTSAGALKVAEKSFKSGIIANANVSERALESADFLAKTSSDSLGNLIDGFGDAIGLAEKNTQSAFESALKVSGIGKELSTDFLSETSSLFDVAVDFLGDSFGKILGSSNENFQDSADILQQSLTRSTENTNERLIKIALGAMGVVAAFAIFKK